MADNNLNPGQKHYEDTYGQYGRIRDIEDQAASGYEHDYSSPADHSAGVNNSPIQDHNNINSASDNFLNNAEQDMANQSPISSSRDLSLGQQERSASHQTSGFSNSQSPISGRQKARLSGFKKKAIIAGVTVFAAGGLFTGLFTAISGPLQLVQAANLIQDFQLGVTSAQKSVRALSNAKNIVNALTNGGDTFSKRVQNSRVGIFGRKQANTMIDRLAERGLVFDSSPIGSPVGMTIDPAKGFGLDKVTNADLDSLAKDMGISKDKLSITPDGNIHISDNVSFREARQVISSIDDPAMTGVRSWMQTRATLKMTGYVSWLHPIEKAKNAMYKGANKLREWAGDQLKSVLHIDDAKGRIKKANGEPPEDLDAERTTVDDVYDSVADIQENNSKKPSRAIFAKVKNGLGNIKTVYDKFTSMRGMGILELIIGFICMVQTIREELGPYKMANIANVAEKGAALVMGYGSQVMSGEDIDMDQAGLAVQMTMGDDIEILGEDGLSQDPPQYQFSSFWDAQPISTTLGTTSGDSREEIVPGVLKTVADRNLNFFGNAAIDQFINDLIASPAAYFGCWAFTVVNAFDLVGNFVGDLLMKALEMITNALGLTDIVNEAASNLAAYFLGKVLDLSVMSPEQWGSASMYGGVFMSNNQSRLSGGRKLTDQQAIELNLENRRYLAWENSRKPIMARLFDPADYSSSINQLARAVHINSSKQDLSTQLANVLSLFTSAPTILATATNQLIGGNAYAASTYDYGVPTYAWESSEMDAISTTGNEYDLYTNTENALEVLYNEDDFEERNEARCNGNPVENDPDIELKCLDLSEGNTIKDVSNDRWHYLPAHTYSKYCLSAEIEDESGDYAVDPVDNSDGEGWNYIDNGDDSHCTSLESDPSMMPIRLYIMDYFNVVSGMCYYGDSGDSEANSACNEMEVGTTGTSGGVALGSQDPNVYQQAFASYMKEHGSVEGLTVCYNGCTTVPAWFVSQYTDLTYGQGNGWQVASNLANANGLELKNTLDGDCKLPAVFSTSSPAMGSVSACSSGAAPNGLCGHTGLVVSMDDDGTIQTLESGSSQCGTENLSWIQTRTRSEWEGDADFVCLGDYMK